MSANANSVIHCLSCHKPVLSQVALAEGSRFVVRCANPTCGAYMRILAGFGAIHKRLLTEPRERAILTSEEPDV